MKSSIHPETVLATFAAPRAFARFLPMSFVAGLLVLGSAARPASAQTHEWLPCGGHYAGFSAPCADAHTAPTHSAEIGGHWATLTLHTLDLAHPESVAHDGDPCSTATVGAHLSACTPIGTEVVPEPLTIVMVGSGLAGIAAARRRRKAGLLQGGQSA